MKTLVGGREERDMSCGRVEVETREMMVCLSWSNLSFDRTSSSCEGRTQMKMTLEESGGEGVEVCVGGVRGGEWVECEGLG